MGALHAVQRIGVKPKELAIALDTVPDWNIEGDEITRTYECGSFREAVALVAKVADLAEEQNHHPHIAIDWRKVTLRLTTHSAGGLTQKDFTLAVACDAAA